MSVSPAPGSRLVPPYHLSDNRPTRTEELRRCATCGSSSRATRGHSSGSWAPSAVYAFADGRAFACIACSEVKKKSKKER